MSKIRKGIILALMTAFISGFANFIAKIGVTVADPFVHTTLRVGIVAVLLTIIMQSRGGFNEIRQSSSGIKIKLLLIGLLGGGVPFILFFVGLTQTNALSAALIHKTLYLWVALLALIFLREKITFKQTLGYITILWGNLLFSQGLDFKFGVGEMMIFSATILWAIENIIAKIVLSKVKPVTLSWVRMMTGTFIIAAATLFTGKGALLFSLNWPQIITILAGAATLFLYVITWYKALSLLPATLTAALLVPATLVTNFLSGLFLSHTLAIDEIISGTLIILGIIFIIYFSGSLKFNPENLFKKHAKKWST